MGLHEPWLQMDKQRPDRQDRRCPGVPTWTGVGTDPLTLATLEGPLQLGRISTHMCRVQTPTRSMHHAMPEARVALQRCSWAQQTIWARKPRRWNSWTTRHANHPQQDEELVRGGQEKEGFGCWDASCSLPIVSRKQETHGGFSRWWGAWDCNTSQTSKQQSLSVVPLAKQRLEHL